MYKNFYLPSKIVMDAWFLDNESPLLVDVSVSESSFVATTKPGGLGSGNRELLLFSISSTDDIVGLSSGCS